MSQPVSFSINTLKRDLNIPSGEVYHAKYSVLSSEKLLFITSCNYFKLSKREYLEMMLCMNESF